MSAQLWWYVARATGMVGWALLAASVVWGLSLSTKTRPPTVRPNWVLDLHRFLGGLATIFTVVHVGAIVADSYTHFGPTDIIVPFASDWKPTAVAWGVTSMYLLAAVELTSLARRRLPRRVWRAIHLASFPLFATSTVHALTAGTDTSNPIFTTLVWVVSAVVVALTARRVQQALGDRPVASDRPTRQHGRPIGAATTTTPIEATAPPTAPRRGPPIVTARSPGP